MSFRSVLAAAALLAASVSPSLAWDLADLNKRVDGAGVQVGTGCSGTIILNEMEETLILTAHHCVKIGSWNMAYKSYGTIQISQEDFNKEDVKVGERGYIADITAYDKDTDLALLRLRGNFRFGDVAPVIGEKGTVTRGESIWVVGNPLGERSSVTRGVVSSVQRDNEASRGTPVSIQVDAGIVFGNSGGAIYNDAGQLIGVANMVAAIPIGFGASIVTTTGYAVNKRAIHAFLKKAGYAQLYGGTNETKSPWSR